MIIHNCGNKSDNKISLTFDDGPNPYWTVKVLDLLDKHNIKATFFVLGKWAEKNKEIVKEIKKRGHLMGNHSYSHSKDDIFYPNEFAKAESIISEIIGEPTKFIRPPYLKDFCGKYEPVLNGRVEVIYGKLLNDWHESVENIYNLAERNIEGGDIIILHDGSENFDELESRPKNMFESLPKIIDLLKEKGLDFVTLDKMIFK